MALLATRSVSAADGSAPGKRSAGHLHSWRRHIWPIVFLIPMVVLFAGFTVWPMVASWVYAFFDWDGRGPLSADAFVGFDNFREVLNDPLFWHATRNSLIFSLAAIAVEVPIALALAFLLNRTWLRGRSLYRLLIFLPVVSTTAVIGIIFVVLLDPAGGPVNHALLNLWFVDQPVNFLGGISTALGTVIAVDIWKSLGITLVYWLAALQTVPNDVYEAAAIDGASARQTLMRITIPLIAPLGVVILILTFQKSLNPFDLVQTMTGGGPGTVTEVEATYVFKFAFDPEGLPRYGFASAAGAVFGLFVLVATLLFAPILRWSRSIHSNRKQTRAVAVR